jgi:hypothetical protein
VPNVVVAADAVKFFVIIGAMRGDFAREFFVAVEAIRIQHGGVAGFDADWLVKILEGESLRVVVAVAGFGEVFADKVMRHVAVVADSVGVVR